MYRILSIIFLAAGMIQCTHTQKVSQMKPHTLYGLQGAFLAQEGKGQELAQILMEASALMQSAKGCHLYVIALASDNPDEVWVSEIWESKEDHDNSLGIPGVKELIGQAIPILKAPPEKGKELEVVGGLGI